MGVGAGWLTFLLSLFLLGGIFYRLIEDEIKEENLIELTLYRMT